MAKPVIKQVPLAPPNNPTARAIFYRIEQLGQKQVEDDQEKQQLIAAYGQANGEQPAQAPPAPAAEKTKRKISAAARKRIAEAQKARWEKARKEKAAAARKAAAANKKPKEQAAHA